MIRNEVRKGIETTFKSIKENKPAYMKSFENSFVNMCQFPFKEIDDFSDKQRSKNYSIFDTNSTLRVKLKEFIYSLPDDVTPEEKEFAENGYRKLVGEYFLKAYRNVCGY